MQAVFNAIIFNLKYYGFWVLYFVIARLLFVGYYFDITKTLAPSELFFVFVYGLRLDLSIAAYLVIIPFILVLFCSFLSERTVRLAHKTYSFGFVLLMNILLSIDLFLYSYWNARLDTTFIRYLNTPDLMFASTTTGDLILFIGLIIGLTSLTCYSINYFFYKGVKEIERIPLWGIPVLTLLIGLLLLPMRGGLQTIPINQSNVYFSNTMYVNHAAVNYAWNFMHALSKQIDVNEHPFVAYEPKEAKSILESLRQPLLLKDSILNPIFKTKKPNILFVIWEGFTAKVVGPLDGDVEITPNFNRLSEEGLLFTNFYANGDRTDKGLVALLSGYYPQPKKSIIKIPMKSKKLPLLSKSLKAMGYQNSFYYGGDLNFGNMNTYLFGKGIDEIYGSEIFEHKDWNSKWGVHDHVLFDRVAADFNEAPQEEPFFKTILTLTSHEPYEFPGVYRFGDDTELNRFKSSMVYTDQALGDFVAFAKEQTWWENTVVIITADHGHPLPPIPLDNFNAPSRFQIPMLWLGGALEPKGTVNTNLGSQVDLAYTLLDLLGADNSAFEFGTHLFNSSKKHFVHYVFNQGFGAINDSGFLVYDFIKKDAVQTSDSKQETLKANGSAILQTTYQDFLEK
ncbi:sulfatase-like hydrolase/transferase [Flavobacteriaceae bacterium]|nr:sulfatase-like hydrolase/transferase [Flavobacteriaceae bacterium]